MISNNEILLRLLLSALFGAVIGLERERKNWSAGIRTHMMVCVGSALFMIISAYGFSGMLSLSNVSIDPSRIAAQVVSGIGFICAGSILFLKQGVIRGLTTASGLWTVSAIGLATGQGMFFAAGIVTVISLIILWLMQLIEHRITKNFKPKNLHIILNHRENNCETLTKLLLNQNIANTSFSYDKKQEQTHIQIIFEKIDEKELTDVIRDLENHNNIKEIYWNN